ncbi:hypothetical protein L1275_002741 [Flavobacterium sp. HSC-61S13]|nr:hypothetical protein [Flavobacterium sp. HSC-61S13]
MHSKTKTTAKAVCQVSSNNYCKTSFYNSTVEKSFADQNPTKLKID